MNILDIFFDDCIKWLKSIEQFREYRIVKAFPPNIKPSPLKNVTLACGIDSMNFSNSVLGDNISEGRGAQAEIKITLSIHIPPKNGGSEGLHICGILAQELFFNCPFSVLKMECGKISYSRETDSFILPVAVFMRTFLREVVS